MRYLNEGMSSNSSHLSLFLLCIIVISYSCVSSSKQKYFSDFDQLVSTVRNPKEPNLIMPFDKVNIQVFSVDEKTSELFSSYNSNESGMTEYLVDKAGNIRFPLIGKININGLTPDDASLKLEEVLSSYVADVNVTIRFTENLVTVMGEVNNQGTFAFTQDKINVYQAITLGGGISQYGNRKKVVLIRQNGDDISYYKLNLSDSRIGREAYYYIQPNDIIIVEPLKSASWFKFNSSSFTAILSTFSSFVMLYMLVVYRL